MTILKTTLGMLTITLGLLLSSVALTIAGTVDQDQHRWSSAFGPGRCFRTGCHCRAFDGWGYTYTCRNCGHKESAHG